MFGTCPLTRPKQLSGAPQHKGRSYLRAAGFKVLLDFRDLGAHLQTSRRMCNRTQVDRIQNLDDRWPRLASSQAPLSQKVRALATAAWPAALRAVSITPVGECHFSSLRSKAMKGLNLKAPGANPLLQLSLMEYPVSDPFFFAVRSSFFDLKCLAGPEVVCPLLDVASESVARVPGPATLLLNRANLLGIAWHPSLGKFHDAFGSFDLWQSSCAEVQMRLCYAWQTQAQEKMCHRPSFRGLDLSDPGLTRRLFWSFPAQEQAFLKISLNGTFFTNDALCHCGEDESRDCSFCGQPDSLEHRVVFCPHFASCRAEAETTEEFLSGLSQAQALHAWAGAPPSLLAVRRALAGLDSRFADFHCCPAVECLDVFTDGSCLRPREPYLRLAAWAVMYAPLEASAPPQLISAGLVPGLLQTPYRGELCALVSALTFAWTTGKKLRVWTDCQSLLRRFRRWQNDTWQPSQRSRHWDLWCRVVPFFDEIRSRLSFHKVAAHRQADAEDTFADEWCTEHNTAVDAAARQAQELRGDSFWTLWRSLCEQVSWSWSVGRTIMRLHVLIARKAVMTRVPRHPTVLEVPLPTKNVSSYLGRVGDEARLHLSHRYGYSYVDRLQRWSTMLHEEPSELRWVSTLQLFLLFCLTWRSAPPVLRQGRWQDVDSIPYGQCISFPLPKRVAWFQQTLRQFAKRAQGRWYTRELRPSSATLQARLTCVALRVSNSSWLEVESFPSNNLRNGVVRSHERHWHSLPVPRGSLS